MVSRKTVSALTIAAFLASASPQSVAALMAPVIAQAIPSFPVPDSVPAGTAIRISSGSDNMNAISEALRQGFEEEYSDSQITITRKDASAALQDVLNDNADLAAISRPLTDEEKAKGLFAIPVQREKIAVVVGKDSPFSGGLTGSQFAQIFRGEITDWSGVGGSAGPIRMIDRPAASETRQSLQAYPVFKTAAFETGANATQLSEDSTVALAEELGTDGIGYALVGQLAGQPDLKALELHKTLPSDPNYPFSQPYAFVYAGGASPATAAFLGYATGSPGQAALSSAGVTTPRLTADGDSATTAAAGTAETDGIDGSTAEAGNGTAREDADGVDGSPNSDIEGAATENEGYRNDGQNDWRSWRDNWWWLLPLLPLLGLGLMILAAAKRGNEEKAIYIANTDIANTEPNNDPSFDRNANEIRSASSGSLASESSGLPVVPQRELSRASDDIGAGYEKDSDRTFVPSSTQANADALEADSAGPSGSESWLDRAKQRINEAAEQVEDRSANTTVNTKDDLAQK